MTSGPGPVIAIYGATGTTGRLVAAALRRRERSIRLVGRDHGRLAALAAELGGPPFRAAPAHDRAALERALAGAAVVVSCAGPFMTLGEPILAAALAVGAHYLDTCGEQAFVRQAYERYDAVARRAGVTAVPSTAFEVALGDWAAELVAAALIAAGAARDPGDAGDAAEPADPRLDELVAAYTLEGFRATAATQSSAIASLTAPGVRWEDDRWVAVAPAAHARGFEFPPPFGPREAWTIPAGEVVTVPRHVAVRRVECFGAPSSSPLGQTAGRLASLAAPILPALLASPLGGLLRAQAAAFRAVAVETADLGAARFAIVVEASSSAGRRRLTLSGRDPYGVTARVVGHAVAALVDGGRPRPGVLTPAEAFPAGPALRALADAGDLTIAGDDDVTAAIAGAGAARV